jgi:hypothetical protein
MGRANTQKQLRPRSAAPPATLTHRVCPECGSIVTGQTSCNDPRHHAQISSRTFITATYRLERIECDEIQL